MLQGFTLHKKEAAWLIILFDVLSTLTMMYFFTKLESLNLEFLDIISTQQLSLADFSVVCRSVVLDKYTQDPLIIRMKIWLHFTNLLKQYIIADNN
jgi:hypothetical protein